jgi:5-methyltetrahydrofolate--homocysteine methyltransferase
MPMMKTIIEALKEVHLREKVKVMIGGAPVTESYVKQIGADGYALDASRAVFIGEVIGPSLSGKC